MDAALTAVNAVVVGAVGLALWWAFRGRFEALEKRMDSLEARMERLEASFRTGIDALRRDLTMVALAVGARTTAENE